MLTWLTGEKTLRVPGRILAVNGLMLAKMLATSAKPKRGGAIPLIVFYYDDEADILAERVLRALEEAEDVLGAADVVKICEVGVADEYDLSSVPAISFVRRGNMEHFQGDLRQIDKIVAWLDKNLRS